MIYIKRHLPDIEQWSQSRGFNVIPRRARPGLDGLRPHTGGGSLNPKSSARRSAPGRLARPAGGYEAHAKVLSLMQALPAR